MSSTIVLYDKVKVHVVKTYWGVELQPYVFLTSALEEGEWSGSRLGRFDPRETVLRTHWIEGWVILTAGLDAQNSSFKGIDRFRFQCLIN
jgi:hypothetical protein